LPPQISPDYLIIGHIARDNTPQGPLLGGTCSYAALTAHRLGRRVAMVTSAGPDIPSLDVLDGIQIELLPHPHSTIFENIYEEGVRHQKWLATARPLSRQDIPPAWRSAPIVHLAPLSQEMHPSLCADFPNSMVGVTMQGWLRGQDTRKNVVYRPHPALEAWLPRVDVLILSLNDLFGDQKMLEKYLSLVKVGVETLGADGCRLFVGGQVIHVPVQKQPEADPTGAGDIFAAAFFIHYHQTGDPLRSAQFANACASLSVGKVGLAGVPTRADVEAQMARLYGSSPQSPQIPNPR